MRKRTKAREFALQVLYQMDITHEPLEVCFNGFWENRTGEDDPTIKEFTWQLVNGVQEYREAIDQRIAQCATNWQLKRMAVVDRNILRQACFELLYLPDIPPKVSINEAIDLAKRFSGAEAGKFVNGILDKIRIEINKT